MSDQEVNTLVEIHSDVINRKDSKLEGLRVILTLSNANQNRLLLKLYVSNPEIRLVDATDSQTPLMSGGDLVGVRDERIENLRIVLVFYYANPQNFNDLCVRVECNRNEVLVERDYDGNTGDTASPNTGDTASPNYGESDSPNTSDTSSSDYGYQAFSDSQQNQY